jgi:hypothetical protein
VKYSNTLKRLYSDVCKDYVSEYNAVDSTNKPVDAWHPDAVAWSTIGLLEREYYTPDTGKYDKQYFPIVELLQGTQCHNYPDAELAEHGRWWGAILTALADES